MWLFERAPVLHRLLWYTSYSTDIGRLVFKPLKSNLSATLLCRFESSSHFDLRGKSQNVSVEYCRPWSCQFVCLSPEFWRVPEGGGSTTGPPGLWQAASRPTPQRAVFVLWHHPFELLSLRRIHLLLWSRCQRGNTVFKDLTCCYDLYELHIMVIVHYYLHQGDNVFISICLSISRNHPESDLLHVYIKGQRRVISYRRYQYRFIPLVNSNVTSI